MNGSMRAIAATGATGLVAWAAAGALAHDRPPRLGAMSAQGGVRLLSPESGTAVLSAGRLLPGESVAGTVRLANTGDAPGMLELDATGVQDTPGAGGGRMSAALVMRVDDVTAAPVTVFNGPLAGLSGARLGRLDAGAARRYRVVATLPDSGPFGADNALQGAATRLDLSWHAEPLPPAATPTPSPPPVEAPPPRVERPAEVLTLRIPWQRVMLTRGITLSGRCDRRCRLTFTAVLETAPRGGGAGRVVMRGRVFRVAGSRRMLRPGAERWVRLRLTPQAVRRMRSVLLVRGRVAVRVDARVRSSLGAATVRRRIVIVTSRRAARHRAAR
jgi:hypothetical protein